MTPAPTASSPLRLSFTLDASQLLPGQGAATIEIRKDGVAVASCAGAQGVASPDPCVSSRLNLADGDAQLVVLSSTASDWSSLGNVCGVVPALDCRPALVVKSTIAIRENGDKDTLRWTWKSAPAIALGLFGNPLGASDQTVCVYDAAEDTAEGQRLRLRRQGEIPRRHRAAGSEARGRRKGLGDAGGIGVELDHADGDARASGGGSVEKQGRGVLRGVVLGSEDERARKVRREERRELAAPDE